MVLRTGRVLQLLFCVLPAVIAGVWFAAGAAEARDAAAEKRRQSETQMRLRSVQIAALCYAAEHKERLPAASNWEGALAPYLNGSVREPFTLPAPKGYRPRRIALNSALAGRSLASSEAGGILFFESTASGPNAVDNVVSVPTRTDGGEGYGVGYAGGYYYHQPFGYREAIQADCMASDTVLRGENSTP